MIIVNKIYLKTNLSDQRNSHSNRFYTFDFGIKRKSSLTFELFMTEMELLLLTSRLKI